MIGTSLELVFVTIFFLDKIIYKRFHTNQSLSLTNTDNYW